MRISGWRMMFQESPRRIRWFFGVILTVALANSVLMGLVIVDAQRPSPPDLETVVLVRAMAVRINDYRASSGEYPDSLGTISGDNAAFSASGGADQRVRYLSCPSRQEYLLWVPTNHWVSSFDVVAAGSLSYEQLVSIIGDDGRCRLLDDGVVVVSGGSDVIHTLESRIRQGEKAHPTE